MTKTVLITGADGMVGTRLREALREDYALRLLTRHALPHIESIVADISSDMSGLIPAFQGVDSIIHLAADPSQYASWESALSNNIIGTYNVFEAAHQAEVKQIIFASSNHAVGTYAQDFMPGPERADYIVDHLVPIRPDGFYGVSKSFGEALGSYYAYHVGMHVICLRIGWITKDDRPHGDPQAPGPAMWQSHRDFAQLVKRCLEADQVRYDIFYGVSNNPYRYFDLQHAKDVVGYEPQDGQ